MGDKIGVLVIDDQSVIRLASKTLLGLHGFEVDLADDGVQGMAMLKANKYAVVFTDVEMPNMNGFELLARAKKDPALASVPIIMYTTLNSAEHIEKGRKLGATSYIVKPMNEQTLQRALKNAVLS